MPFADVLQSGPFPGAWLPLADAVLKATILLAIAAAASLALRRSSAAARHLVWTLAMVSALALPALSLALPRWQLPLITLAASAPATSASNSAAGAVALASPDSLASLRTRSTSAPSLAAATRDASADLPQPAAMPWSTIILWIWAAGAALVMLRLAAGLIAVQWMTRRTARVTDAPWLPLARELAAGLGITPRILFLRSSRASMPMAWGVLLPSVLMPADADTWPVERLRIVLLHELAHVKRRDCLTHVLAQVACALYWFNPLAWIAARHLRTERERACDDLVLASGTRGPDYADQLLEIARVMRAGRYPGVLASASLAMAHRSQLEGRLMAILDPTVPRTGVTRVRTALATALFAVALMPLASMQPWAHAAAPDVAAAPAPPAAGAAAQNPTPMPMPTPMPTPAPHVTSGLRHDLESIIPGAVEAGLRSALGAGMEGVVEGALEGALEGVQERGRRAADPKTVAALTAALKDSNMEVREAALQALVQMRSPGIYEPLVQALSDESPDMRQSAAFGLGQLRDARAVAPLSSVLNDSNADVRQQAAFALGQMRDPAAFDGLVIAMRDEIADVRQQAAFALGQLRDRRAVEPLISGLKDPDADVRQQSAFGLGQLRDRAAVEALIVALNDKAADVRQQAAFALGQLGDPRAIDSLTNALKDASADVRQQAAFALGQLAR